ncbi:MAG TPA: monovalent cation/H(+) antiporter subunit G [Bryobacteraceae bacterium]|nr:monovalent cation/H(+) antiporter subunit G [Bryobacteraceae bacterium]
MNARDALVWVLLAIGVLGFLLCALGLLLTRDFYDQLHFLAPASLIGAVAIPAAILVHDGFSQTAVKAILIAILLFWANPVLTHASARAGRIRRKGQWPPTDNETFPTAPEKK